MDGMCGTVLALVSPNYLVASALFISTTINSKSALVRSLKFVLPFGD